MKNGSDFATNSSSSRLYDGETEPIEINLNLYDKGERVVIEKSFSVLVPDFMKYTTDQSVLSDPRVFSAVKVKAESDEDWEGDVGSPFTAPQCFVLTKGQSYFDNNTNNLMEMIESGSGIKLAKSIWDTMGYKEREIVTNSPDLITAYAYDGETDFQIAVITDIGFYAGQIWINEDVTDETRKKVAKKILSNIQAIKTQKQKKDINKVFEVTYDNNCFEPVGEIAVSIPDQLTVIRDLKENAQFFSLIAQTDEVDIDDTALARFSIVVQRPQELGQLATLTQSKVNIENVEVIFQNLLISNLKATDKYFNQEVKYVKNDSIHVVYCIDRIKENQRTYAVFIFAEKHLYGCHLYFNDESLFSKSSVIVDKWVKKICSVKVYKENEEYSKKNNIDAKDVPTHKKYLELKARYDVAKTSKEMEQIKKDLKSLNSYLDSDSLADEAGKKEKVLKEEELYKQEKIFNEQVGLFEKALTKQNYKAIISALQNQQDHKESKKLIDDCNKRIAEIEEIERKEKEYSEAIKLLDEKNLDAFDKGMDKLKKLEGFKDSAEVVTARVSEREELVAAKEAEDKEVEKIWQQKRKDAMLAKGLASCTSWSGYFAYVNPDETVTVNDDKVVVFGKQDKSILRNEVARWKEIKAVAAVGAGGVVGLKWDGTCVYVVTPGKEREYALSDVLGWSDIEYIDSNERYCVGLDKYGNCYATQYHLYSKSENLEGNVSKVRSWTNVESISCSGFNTASCMKNDGTICSTETFTGERSLKDIKLASVGAYNIVYYTNGGKFTQKNCTEMVPTLSMDVREKKPVDIRVTSNNCYILYEDNSFKGGYSNYYNVLGINPSDTSLIYVTDDGYAHKGYDTFKVFDDFDNYRDHEKIVAIRKQKEAEEKARIEQEKKERRDRNVCQHCGGEFKRSLFVTKCIVCGKKKDY